MDWDRLKIVSKYPEIFETTRSYAMEKKYINHKKMLQRKNISLKQHIISSYLSNKSISLEKNLFPYMLKPGIIHNILWSRHKLSKYEIDSYLNVFQREIIWYENPGNLKSIPGVYHVHVFIKE